MLLSEMSFFQLQMFILWLPYFFLCSTTVISGRPELHNSTASTSKSCWLHWIGGPANQYGSVGSTYD